MLCLFEDRTTDNFYPLILTRHVSDLLVGTATLRERAAAVLGEDPLLHGRGYIRDYYQANGVNPSSFPQSVDLLCINARLLVDSAVVEAFPKGERWMLTAGESVAAARLIREDVERLNWEEETPDFDSLDLPTYELTGGRLYAYLWDLLQDNPERIAADFAERFTATPDFSAPGVHLLNPEQISIAPGVTLKPGAVIDASGGPVILAEGCTVMANSVIEGPCYIGPNGTIKIGAKIYEGSSFGPRCKIGGEVENSVVIGYSNKQHDGFLGHSYLGSWVNLGADTNTSDLKNNYGAIRVRLNGRDVDSGRMFLGSLIGDHSKTGINTMLNTGTVIGVSANVFGGGFPPKEIPSFGWGGADGMETFRPEKAIELARTVVGRRNLPWTAADERLLTTLWNEYAPQPSKEGT